LLSSDDGEKGEKLSLTTESDYQGKEGKMQRKATAAKGCICHEEKTARLKGKADLLEKEARKNKGGRPRKNARFRPRHVGRGTCRRTKNPVNYTIRKGSGEFATGCLVLPP